MKRLMYAVTIALLIVTGTAIAADAPQYNDKAALSGVKTGKIIFDNNISEEKKMMLYLTVVDQTITDLERQKVRPDFIMAFRGKAVMLVSKETDGVTAENIEFRKIIADKVAALQKRGVKMEACSIATRVFETPNESILPGISIVGNTFVSLAGYQTKGYSIIPLY